MSGSKEIEQLIAQMGKLPGLGPRSARRAVLHLIKKRDTLLLPMADAMERVSQTARKCIKCGNIGNSDICDICSDSKRENGQICVLSDVADLWAMERTALFKGRYHVLGGALSALDGIGPDELNIPQLLDRLKSENVSEVILALNATIDGQTTAHYIAEQLEDLNISVTTLAQGVPVGGELDYLDDGTISAALNARKSL
ncbi:MAG: recombination mediator RecR [Pseudomonadota bacterium]